MSFLSQEIENQKRKRDEAANTTTTTATTTGAAKGPICMPKFQRRGAAPRAPVPPTNTQSNLATTPSSTNNTQQPLKEQQEQTQLSDTKLLVHLDTTTTITSQTTEPSPVTTISKPPQQELDPEQRAIVLQLQQDRLDELSLARFDRYSVERDANTFPSVHAYEVFALKRYLWLWEQDLMKRSSAEADGFYGKIELQDYNECRRDMRPLFSQIRSLKVKNEILLCVANVLDGLSRRDYIKAEQAFLDVAIGNNPWPVGLPKVGIHERRAREKIDPSLVDHLLKDPTIQTYMQALKRLMAWVSKKFPPQ